MVRGCRGFEITVLISGHKLGNVHLVVSEPLLLYPRHENACFKVIEEDKFVMHIVGVEIYIRSGQVEMHVFKCTWTSVAWVG